MKLKYKALIAITATWGLFLAVLNTSFIQQNIFDIVIVGLICALLTTLIIYVSIIKKIEQLIHKVKLEIRSRLKLQVNENKEEKLDEIEAVQYAVYQLLNKLTENAKRLEKHLEETKEEIEKKDSQIQQEISERISIEQKLMSRHDTLTQLAHYDNLTALPNRIFFNEILNKAMNHAKRHKRICAVLFVDIDHFKKINENYGSSVGDLLLKEIGERLSKTLRSEDILARFNGDQFSILLNDINKPKFASSVSQKLLKICSEVIKIDSHRINLTISIGISIYPNDGASLEDLLRNTDSALYKAKHAGGNTYQFYTQEMDIEAHEFIQLENALRKAIKNSELVLYYQPKLHIKKGKINGVEALIRWVHPELGTIDPAKLISLAEETGLSMKIAEWALREACRMNKYWQDEGYEHISIAVNLSPKQFHHPDINKIVATALTETGLNPKYLELEINETTVMDDMESATQVLNKLKSLGVQLSIDHFGVGYTSISHLKQFPISIIKIDQNFIKGLPFNPNDLAITNAFIALAHNLGLAVVASGVETADQVQYLALQNCDILQGYFLSHPLPAQKIIGQFTKLSDEVLI